MFLSLSIAVRSPRRRRTRPLAEPLEGRQLLTAGQLDPTFGGTGYLLTSPWSAATETYIDRACAVEVLSDGSILVAGDSADQFALMKFRPNGTLDASFGSGGRVLTPLLNGDMAADMAIQPDGKIVLVGQVDASVSGKGGSITYNRDFGILRYNANGTLDTSFGPNGTGMIRQGVSTATASGSTNLYDYAYAVAVQPDGKILVGGRSYGGATTSDDSSLVRFNSNGTLDTTFGSGGKVITPFGTGVDQIRDIAVLPDGRILVGGYVANAGGSSRAFVARYLANGAVDPTFGSSGIATLFNTSYFLFGDGTNMVVDPASGSITVAGMYANGANNDIALARLTADGAIDLGFGSGGMSVVGTSADEYVTAIAQQPDGRIVAVGYVVSGGVHNAMVARFEAGGAIDTSFGNGGFSINSFSADEVFDDLYDVAIQPDGKIVAVGKATASVTKKATDRDFLIARFQGDLAPLLASAASPNPVRQSLTAAQARPVLTQALVS